MEVNSSPHVLFTAASRSPSEACTAAPNALFTFAPGPRVGSSSAAVVYVAAVYVCALVPEGDASARSARSVATSPGMLPNLIDAALSGRRRPLVGTCIGSPLYGWGEPAGGARGVIVAVSTLGLD